MILMFINANGQNSAFVKMNVERYQNTHVLIYYILYDHFKNIYVAYLNRYLKKNYFNIIRYF